MHNGKAAARYLRQVNRYLTLPRNEKRALLEGLSQELQEFEEAHPEATYETIEEAFEKPHMAARELTENAGFTADPKAGRRRRIFTFGIIAALFLLAAGLSGWLLSVLSSQEVEVTETIYYDGEPRKLPDIVAIGSDSGKNS